MSRERRQSSDAGRRGSAASRASAPPPPAPSSSSSGGGAPDKIVRIKVLTMGCAEVGKSCIVKRYCEGRFINKYIQTVGVDYGVKPVDLDGRKVRVNFWDLSGKSEFFEVRNEFYKDTQCALLVYDVSDRSSFDGLENWLKEANKYGMPRDLPVALCANKVDKPRKVSEDDGRAFASKYKYDYFETSAHSGMGVTDVFECVFRKALQKLR